MVYLKVVTKDDGTGIIYSPMLQPDGFYSNALPEPGIGSWYTHNVLTSGVRYNDDGDNYGNIRWSEAVARAGGPDTPVKRVSVTAGCNVGSGNVQVDDITVNRSVVTFQ